MSMTLEPVEGWQRCQKVESGETVLHVLADVGPRIISLRHREDNNWLLVKEATRGRTGGAEYCGYGGHRLWTSPEVKERTNEPDNAPPHHDDGWWITKAGPSGLEKAIRVTARGEGFSIQHRIRNVGHQVWNIAAWAISVMGPGGVCVVPTPELQQPGTVYLPDSPLVCWPYCRFSDARFDATPSAYFLEQTSEKAPFKFGCFVPQGWAAYVRGEKAFIKTFGGGRAEEFPDFGCNFEAYTRHDMLEVESLGRLTRLQPGEQTSHEERWQIVDLPIKYKQQSRDDLLRYLGDQAKVLGHLDASCM